MAITRKKDTGEAGNGGQFGSTRRSEATIEIDPRLSDEHLTDKVRFADHAGRLVERSRAFRDDQGFLAVDVTLKPLAGAYGRWQVSTTDPADIDDADASDSQIEAAIDETFDDPEGFADRAGWPGTVSFDRASSTLRLRTDERTASDVENDEDLLEHGPSDAVAQLDAQIAEIIDREV